MNVLTTMIKSYVERAHKDGKGPTIRQIAESFGCSTDQVRKSLAEIRREHGGDVADFFKRTFGWKL